GGPQRSVASYCHYFFTEGAKIRNQDFKIDRRTKENPLATIGMVGGAPAEMATFFHHLAGRAPTWISDDVQTIYHAFKKEADDAGTDITDPLGGLASGLANGLASMNAYQRVNDWTTRHCGPPPR